MSLINGDLALVAQQDDCKVFQNVPVSGCLDIIKNNPKHWYRVLRNTLRMPYFSLVPAANIRSGEAARQSEETSFVCHVCTHVSYSYQSHCLHLFKSHKIKNQLSRFVNKTSCPVCLKEFHNRERALNHFKYRAKTTCTPYLIKRGPVLTEKQARKLDEQEKENNNKLHAAGKRRHHASIPCWKFSGPRIPMNIFCQLYHAPVDTDTEDE